MSTDGTTGHHHPNDAPLQTTQIDLEQRVKSDVSGMASAAREDAIAISSEIGEELNYLKEQAGAQIGELRQQAEQQIGATAEKAKGFAGEQKDVVARQLSGVADALGKVASELEGGEQAALGRYARDISGSIRNFAQTVEQNDVDQLLGRLERFGRGQQLTFLGIAGLAGLAASRFLVASANRRSSGPKDLGHKGGRDQWRADPGLTHQGNESDHTSRQQPTDMNEYEGERR